MTDTVLKHRKVYKIHLLVTEWLWNLQPLCLLLFLGTLRLTYVSPKPYMPVGHPGSMGAAGPRFKYSPSLANTQSLRHSTGIRIDVCMNQYTTSFSRINLKCKMYHNKFRVLFLTQSIHIWSTSENPQWMKQWKRIPQNCNWFTHVHLESQDFLWSKDTLGHSQKKMLSSNPSSLLFLSLCFFIC